MIEFKLDLSRMLDSSVEDGSILVYDEASNTIKGTKIVIKDDETTEFPEKILKLEGTPLGENKVEYIAYDNATEKMIYSNQETEISAKPIYGVPLGSDKIEYLAYDNSENSMRYSNEEVGQQKIDGTPLGEDRVEYIIYDNATNKITYSNREFKGEETGFPEISGTPLGSDKIEYLAYDNSGQLVIYSNEEIGKNVFIEGTPLGDNKVEYLVYDNSTGKIAYSNTEIIGGTIFFYVTLNSDLVGINFDSIIFDSIKDNDDNLYNTNTGEIVFPIDGVYKIEVSLDCIILNTIDLPSDITITIIKNGSIILAEKVYSINQAGETKLIKTEVLLRFKSADKVKIAIVSTAINKGIIIRKSSSLMCNKF